MEGAALMAAGSGLGGAATQLLALLPSPLGPGCTVLLARQAIEEGRGAAALTLLKQIDLAECSTQLRALVRLSHSYAAWWAGDEEAFTAAVRGLRDDRETPAVYRRIADAWSLLRTTDFKFVDVAHFLGELAREQAAEGLSHYQAVSLLNCALMYLNGGRLAEAYEAGMESVRAFDTLPVVRAERASALSGLALIAAEMGRSREAGEFAILAAAPGPKDLDAVAEVAYLSLLWGDADSAHDLLSRATYQPDQPVPQANASRAMTLAVAKQESIIKGPEGVEAILRQLVPTPLDWDSSFCIAVDGALMAHQLGRMDTAVSTASAGLCLAVKQGAGRWIPRLELIHAAATRDKRRMQAAVRAAAQAGELGLLQVAEVVVSELDLCDSTDSSLRDSVSRWPNRWLPLLRQSILRRAGAVAVAAARLLDEFGTFDDIPLLRAMDRRTPRTRRIGLGQNLARRTSPRLEVVDLGTTRLVKAGSQVTASSIRRRASSLLLYLASRGGSAAHREQVLEDLWPDADLGSSTNSLNQTLYFLRREIDEWYEDGVSVDYIHYEGDLLWIDEEMVSIASHVFDKAASRRVSPTDTSAGLAAFDMYTGRFAPEFAYEDWSTDWREHLHARYLRVAQGLVAQFTADREFFLAERVASEALRRDPEALDLERDLVWLYGRNGSPAAATEQYRHYAAASRAQLGLDVASLGEILKSPPGRSVWGQDYATRRIATDELGA